MILQKISIVNAKATNFAHQIHEEENLLLTGNNLECIKAILLNEIAAIKSTVQLRRKKLHSVKFYCYLIGFLDTNDTTRIINFPILHLVDNIKRRNSMIP